VEILEIYISKHFKSLHYIDKCYQLRVTVLLPSEGRIGALGGFTALDARMKEKRPPPTAATSGCLGYSIAIILTNISGCRMMIVIIIGFHIYYKHV